MLEKIKNFILYFTVNISFNTLDDGVLEGLKFSFQEKYPWNNKSSHGKYIDDLIVKETEDAYWEIIRLEKSYNNELAHIFYSYAFIFKFVSIALLTLSLIFIWVHIIPAIISLAGAFILLLLNFILRKKALNKMLNTAGFIVTIQFMMNNEISLKDLDE